jgi:hypothetical protein
MWVLGVGLGEFESDPNPTNATLLPKIQPQMDVSTRAAQQNVKHHIYLEY